MEITKEQMSFDDIETAVMLLEVQLRGRKLSPREAEPIWIRIEQLRYTLRAGITQEL